MSYSAAKDAMESYRASHIEALLGSKHSTWFTSLWGSIGGMLSAFTSGEENSSISAKYMNGKMADKVPPHIKLSYVCSLRRDVRKQYISEEDDVYTDVTPFRHGVISTQGARMFDHTMDDVISKGG